MANLDYQAQLTQIYNKLSDIDQTVSRLALLSSVNTTQESMMSTMNNLIGMVRTLTAEVEQLKLNMSDLLSELRSK